MTAYGAVISVQNTIEHILHSSRISLVPSSRDLIQAAHKELDPFHRLLRRLDGTRKSWSRSKLNALDGRIKDILWRFEDLVESLLSHHILSQFQNPHPHQLYLRREIIRRTRSAAARADIESRGDDDHMLLFSVDLESLRRDVDFFLNSLKLMEKEYTYELEHMPQDHHQTIPSSKPTTRSRRKSKMVGLSDQFLQAKNELLEEHHWKQVYALVGMAGVGKTILARRLYADPNISAHFDCRAWVTVTRTPQPNHVSLRTVLAQLLEGQVDVEGELKKRLEGKRCLIVVDDVWEPQPLIPLISFLSQIHNGTIRILLTSRDRDVIASILPSSTWSSVHTVVRFLDEQESKELLCKKVLGKCTCPPQLDRAATKIAKKCEGLPLLIVKVSHLISKAHNNAAEYWEDVAEMRNSVFHDAYDQVSDLLFPSYDYLPQHLKPLFLFLGVFPPGYEIPPSKILNMLTAEGWFVDTNQRSSLKLFVLKCLKDLCIVHNLVLFTQKSLFWHAEADQSNDNTVKTCRLHSCWRHLCRREARKNKLFLVSDTVRDVSEQQVVQGQRCLCLHNNILFAIKQFTEAVEHNCASSARSLLFFGPYHQYPISFDVGFKLLRELDALKIRFYAFPTEILTLVRLKYLALTCNGEIPSAISKLLNLRVLIIHPHINTRRRGSPSYVPMEIWDMRALEHIEVLGKSLLAPPPITSRGLALRNVSTLLGANASISTVSELSKRIPNVRKLGVEIELPPYDDEKGSNGLLSCFARISELGSLDTLKCSIVNPVVAINKMPGRMPSLMLPVPRGLRKLHLSGMGFPWKYMDSIGSLPFLQVLKLRCYAFRGPKWEAKGHSFSGLRYLLIEDSDLVEWKPRGGSFPKLSLLSLKHCYRVEQLKWPSNSKKGKIELVECNPLGVGCACRLQSQNAATLTVTATDEYQQD